MRYLVHAHRAALEKPYCRMALPPKVTTVVGIHDAASKVASGRHVKQEASMMNLMLLDQRDE